MKTTEFNKPITSKELKENIVKQFGATVNLEKYDREQLEDMRNKLRTRVFHQEGVKGFNSLLKNEAYQKDKAMLELLNTRIKEMLGEQMQKLRDRMDQLSEAKKGTRPPKTKITAKGSKPDFLDMDKDGDKKEPMKKAVADKKGGKPQKGVNPFAKKDEKVKEGKAHSKSCKCDECSMMEEPNEGNAFGKAVRDAKADGVQKGEKVKVGGKEYSVKEAFPTVADAKARAEKEKTTGKFDKKSTTTGTVYTKKHTKADAEHAPEKKVKEGFPTVADAKARHEKEKTTGKFDKKSTSTGTVYTKKHTKADAEHSPEKKKAMAESNINFKHNVRFVNESIGYLLQEDEEGKAKAITAAGDMVNDFTSWMQRVGQYQTKSMIELADAIRADFGAQEAEAFKQAVGPALGAALEVLTQQRELISNAVAVLAGEAAPQDAMGMEPDMGAPMEPGMEPAGDDMMNPEPASDEFGAADAAAGGLEASGRAMRESREQRRARKLAESHSIMAKLAK